MNCGNNQDDVTTDTFINGLIKVKQGKKGYRFSIDAVLLANHAKPKPDDVILDLGTGCGIIPLIMAVRNPTTTIIGVEIQKNLADIATANILDNGFEKRLRIINTDMRQLTGKMIESPVDMVVSNPPYRKINTGRINPDSQRAVARHEIAITLPELVQTAGKMLRTGGKFIIIHLAERMTDVIAAMQKAHIEPKILRIIHSSRQSAAKLILVEGMKHVRPGMHIASPLFIYKNEDKTSYTREVMEMLF